MSSNIFGNRFYGNRYPAWHKLGIVSEKDQNAVDALTAIGGGYWTEKRPIVVMLNGKQVETGDFAIVRSPLPDDPQERVFGYTTERYQMLQPLELCEMFDDAVSRPVETLGMLGKGERLFLTWKMPKIEVVKDDEIQTYGFVAMGLDGVIGTSLNVVTTRVVCQNTWVAAIQEASSTHERGKGRIYSGKHTVSMNAELREWMKYVQKRAEEKVRLTESFFSLLVNKPIKNDAEVVSLLNAAYPDPEPLSLDAYIPDALRGKKERKIEDEREQAQKNRDGIYALFSGAGTSISPDYYGLFNASTEWFNWGQGTKKPAELSVMMGTRAQKMNAMAEVLFYNAK
jgi:hypothetical protein